MAWLAWLGFGSANVIPARIYGYERCMTDPLLTGNQRMTAAVILAANINFSCTFYHPAKVLIVLHYPATS
jgi:hypothetical protein